MATTLESINNMATSAAKAVWGGNDPKNEEPVSGETGDVSKGEPYDAGNKVTGNTENDDNNYKTAPHKTEDSSAGSGDLSKAQQDVRSPEDPQTKPENANAKSNVDDSTDGPDTGNNPDKIDGPGPKPIADVAKAYGGDAGNAKSGEAVDKEGKGEGAEDEDDGDGPQKTSHGEGTGEKYIKSSGLKADGGDFDAANAGAGREAERLLEEKGVHITGDNHGAPEGDEGEEPAEADKEKKSFCEKLKSKLHKPHMTR